MNDIPSVPPGPAAPPAPARASAIRWVNLPIPIPNLQGGALSTALDLTWKVVVTAILAMVLLNRGCPNWPHPKPPVPPVPPGPNTPLSLVAPFSADTDSDKANVAQVLASVYRNQAPAAADRTDIVTIADLDKAVRDASITAIGALSIPNTRTAIGVYLRSRITAQRDTPLTPTIRAQIKVEFTRIATALEALH